MKSYTHYLWLNTRSRRDLINITDEVEAAVRQSGVQE